DDENDDESDDSEEDDGDDDAENVGGKKEPLKLASQSGPCIYTAIYDFNAEQEGDLSVQEGDVLRIIKKSADEWWLAQDSEGNRGVVPRTYLKAGSAADEDNESYDESDDEDLSEEDEEQDSEELSESEKKERFAISSLFVHSPTCVSG
ncbi:unnamed protein product, partial [Tetraodon nigroviridis]